MIIFAPQVTCCHSSDLRSSKLAVAISSDLRSSKLMVVISSEAASRDEKSLSDQWRM